MFVQREEEVEVRELEERHVRLRGCGRGRRASEGPEGEVCEIVRRAEGGIVRACERGEGLDVQKEEAVPSRDRGCHLLCDCAVVGRIRSLGSRFRSRLAPAAVRVRYFESGDKIRTLPPRCKVIST